jgi:hypothetical protein
MAHLAAAWLRANRRHRWQRRPRRDAGFTLIGRLAGRTLLAPMVSRDENPHMAARAESRAEWRRLGVGFTAFIAVLVGLLISIGVGARVAGSAISDAICGSYNFISYDFCDEWNYETPPADALPVSALLEDRMADA